MNKLKLKEITPYLPYDLKIMVGSVEKRMITKNDYKNNYETWFLDVLSYQYSKPLLYPLFRLKEDILIGGKSINPYNEVLKLFPFYEVLELVDGKDLHLKGKGVMDAYFHLGEFPYNVCELLFEYNFDLFNLLGRGLAVEKK